MSVFTMNWPNSTETMAERVWRYGETGLPHRYAGGYWLFPDGSSIWRRWCVHTPRSHRDLVEWSCDRAAKNHGEEADEFLRANRQEN